MRYVVAAAALVAAVIAVAPAGAGGWATVGFAPLPDGTSPGDTWRPEITVRQHGITPLAGLSPVVTIRDVDSGATHTFVAASTRETGVYEAAVVFPEAGGWRVAIDSGFAGSGVTYGPFTVGPGATGGGWSEISFVPALAGVVALMAAAAAAVLGARRLRRLAAAGH